MDIIISLIIFFVIFYILYWFITTYFAEPLRTPILMLVGVLGLVYFIGTFLGYAPSPHYGFVHHG